MPIAASLVAMIYTGSKALQFLRIPIYTIFKNLTIILIAYGEVLWFGGSVTHLMLVSFGLMVSCFFFCVGCLYIYIYIYVCVCVCVCAYVCISVLTPMCTFRFSPLSLLVGQILVTL